MNIYKYVTCNESELRHVHARNTDVRKSCKSKENNFISGHKSSFFLVCVCVHLFSLLLHLHLYVLPLSYT